jgi:hypothetical protein
MKRKRKKLPAAASDRGELHMRRANHQGFRLIDGIRVENRRAVNRPSSTDQGVASARHDEQDRTSGFTLVGVLRQSPPARELHILARISSRGVVWLSLRNAAADGGLSRTGGRKDRVDFPLVESVESLIGTLTVAVRGAQALPVPLVDEAQE